MKSKVNKLLQYQSHFFQLPGFFLPARSRIDPCGVDAAARR